MYPFFAVSEMSLVPELPSRIGAATGAAAREKSGAGSAGPEGGVNAVTESTVPSPVGPS